MRKIVLLMMLFAKSIGLLAQSEPWTIAHANQWFKLQPWLIGCNFIPSTAINELEMWQDETFDKVTIDRELGWAEGIGMNLVRVFLHNVPWQTDPGRFKENIRAYLSIATKHHIKTMFVLFDDCWNDSPKAGKQPDPKPGVHNSGWMQCPGKRMHNDSSTWVKLEAYTKDIIGSFKDDQAILIWDLYNEPGNSNYGLTSLPLLKKIFQWARSVNPSQPLTCGIWYDNKMLNEFQLKNSDIISFHNYNLVEDLEKQIIELRKKDRPLICTEYMARPRGSKFETHLPVFKKYGVGAINWGFVSGKTNTIYEWSKPIPDGSEPQPWFHDIFRKDGTAYDPQEIAFIKKMVSTR